MLPSTGLSDIIQCLFILFIYLFMQAAGAKTVKSSQKQATVTRYKIS